MLPTGIFVNNLLTFSVSTIAFLQSWFLRDGNLVFFLVINIKKLLTVEKYLNLDLDMATKGKPQTRIAAQNNVIRTNYIRTINDNTQQNHKCILCGDRDETVNPIISECNKLAQKEHKTRHDLVGNVIHKELCKRLKFYHTTTWYIHKPKSVRGNETHKIPWDIEIQTDNLIPVRRIDLE